MFQKMNNLKLSDFYPDLESFKNDYDNLGIPKVFEDEETLTILYYLLITRYGFSTISGFVLDAFRPILFTRIWQYGGTWEKKVKIQEKLRSFDLEDDSEIYKGGKTIYNTAFNDSSAPNTGSLEELSYINNQNTTNTKKSKLDGLRTLNYLLEEDVTETFLEKFKDLFRTIIYTGEEITYATYEEN